MVRMNAPMIIIPRNTKILVITPPLMVLGLAAVVFDRLMARGSIGTAQVLDALDFLTGLSTLLDHSHTIYHNIVKCQS